MDKKHNDDILNDMSASDDLNIVGNTPDEILTNDKLDGIWENYEPKEETKVILIKDKLNDDNHDLDEIKITSLDEKNISNEIDLEVSKELRHDFNIDENLKEDKIKPQPDDKVIKLNNNKKKNKITWIYILIAIFLLILISLLSISVLSKDRIIDKILFNLENKIKVKNSEYANFNFDIKTSGNNYYNILNNAIITGVYASENNTFNTNMSVNVNDEVINFDYYNDTNTYFYDEYISTSLLKLNNKYDFSLNSLNKNTLNFLKQLNNKNLTKYVKSELNGLNNKLTLEITQTNINNIVDELRNIKLDNLYQNLINNLIFDMTNNSNNYIGTKIVLDTNIWGSLIKLEISNKQNIILTNNNGFNLEIIDENNKVLNIKYKDNKISITENIGSRNNLTIDIGIKIDYLEENKINMKDIKDIIDVSNISDENEYNIKKNITLDKNRNSLIDLYFYLNDELNTLNMFVTLDNYYVYYKVPNKYNISNYTGDSYKKYIHVDNTIIYNLKKYNNRQVLDYITSLYEKEASSPFYYNVIKKESMNINHQNKNFNYQIVTKTYDSNYSDFDNTSSTIYIWYQLDNNYAFIIEYEFQGSEITNEEITSLLDLQVGR